LRRAAVFAWIALALAACSHGDPRQIVAGADGESGRRQIVRYGCGSCHVIPGVPGATGQVGPPLAGVAGRAYVGGILPNTSDNLVAWIRHPQRFAPRTAMPDLGVSEAEARDIAAYLYTLN
jgi:cytochrome c2